MNVASEKKKMPITVYAALQRTETAYVATKHYYIGLIGLKAGEYR